MININKHDIKAIHPDTLLAYGIGEHGGKSGIVCPNCGNGKGDDGTGMIPTDYNGAPSYYCHRCDTHFDNLDLIAKHFNLDITTDFPKILAEGATLLGGSAQTPHKKKIHVKKQSDDTPVNYSDFLATAFANIESLPESARRGLSLETLMHFNFGFEENWRHPKVPNAPASRRLIIPTSPFHYLARAIDSSVPKEYSKQHVGKKEIFNIDALKNDCSIVVTEGELDAASIWQVSGGCVPVIAVSGCANYKLLLNWLDENPDCHCSFIVAFDDDSKGNNSGQTNAKKFVAELIQCGFPAVNVLLSDRQDFDANDWLQENPDALQDRLFALYDDAAVELEKVADKIQKEKDFQAKIVDFELNFGKLPPDVLGDIVAASDVISSLTDKTFDANLLNDTKFRRQLGLCSFYSFAADSLTNFWKVFNTKRKLAIAKVRINATLDDDEEVIRTFSESDVRKIIKNAAKTVQKFHEEFNKEQEKAERRRKYEERKQREEQVHNESFERLKELKNMPPSDERNSEMVTLISSLLDWQCDRHGTPQFVKPTVSNFRLIFNFDPNIDGLFGYDAFSKAIVFTKEPFWRDLVNDTTCIGNPFKDIDKDIFANYVSGTYGDIACKTNFNRQISEFAISRTFHPIKNFFNRLPAWDGVPRAEKIFVDYLGIDDSPYTREVTLNFFTAALARVYYPGCEYQYMPLFQGNQGIGKGKIIKMLVDAVLKSSYVEMSTKLNDSHAVDILRLAWFVEMPELSSMKNVSTAVVKSFVSARADTNRFAYDKDPSTLQRHCVFFGSVNEQFPLKDKTGNRRFLILRSHLAENEYIPGLTDDYIQQFWAEVFFKFKELFKDGFDENKLLLSKESILTAAEIASDCVEDDGLLGEILDYLDTPIPYKSVWRLLSREERKRFFENSGSITLYDQDLRGRQFARRRPDEMDELERIFAIADDKDDYSVLKTPDGYLTFYGVEDRESICAAEVFNEKYFSFNRQSVSKIAELLAAKLPNLGWSKVSKKNTTYGYQPNTFIRDCAEETTDTPPEPENVAQSEQTTEQPNSEPQRDTEIASDDSVTILSSNGVYVEDEEFLDDSDTADDDFGQFQDLE